MSDGESRGPGRSSAGAEPEAERPGDSSRPEPAPGRRQDARQAPAALDLPETSVTLWVARVFGPLGGGRLGGGRLGGGRLQGGRLTRTLLACGLVGGGLLGCGAEPSPVIEADFVIEPGVGMSPLRLGMRYEEAVAILGEPEGAFVASRVAFARYPDRDLELVLTSPEESELTADAILVGIGVSEGASVRGSVVPGATRAEIEQALGPADVIESFAFYPAGLSVEYEGDRAVRVGAIAPYERRPDVPEMTRATR